MKGLVIAWSETDRDYAHKLLVEKTLNTVKRIKTALVFSFITSLLSLFSFYVIRPLSLVFLVYSLLCVAGIRDVTKNVMRKIKDVDKELWKKLDGFYTGVEILLFLSFLFGFGIIVLIAQVIWCFSDTGEALPIFSIVYALFMTLFFPGAYGFLNEIVK